MSALRLYLFYEDSGPKEQFGLHTLVVRCVADDLGLPDHQLFLLRKALTAHPCNSRDKVLQACRDDAPSLRPTYGCALAIVDGDRLRDNPAFTGCSCRRDYHREFLSHFATHGSAALVVIDDNTETVVNAACIAMGRPAPTKKPTPNGRDATLNEAARQHATRTAIRKAVPSFDRLVRKLACALSV